MGILLDSLKEVAAVQRKPYCVWLGPEKRVTPALARQGLVAIEGAGVRAVRFDSLVTFTPAETLPRKRESGQGTQAWEWELLRLLEKAKPDTLQKMPDSDFPDNALPLARVLDGTTPDFLDTYRQYMREYWPQLGSVPLASVSPDRVAVSMVGELGLYWRYGNDGPRVASDAQNLKQNGTGNRIPGPSPRIKSGISWAFRGTVAELAKRYRLATRVDPQIADLPLFAVGAGEPDGPEAMLDLLRAGTGIGLQQGGGPAQLAMGQSLYQRHLFTLSARWFNLHGVDLPMIRYGEWRLISEESRPMQQWIAARIDLFGKYNRLIHSTSEVLARGEFLIAPTMLLHNYPLQNGKPNGLVTITASWQMPNTPRAIARVAQGRR